MKWVLRIAGGVVALVVFVLGVGALLPVEHTATVTRQVTATPETVWTAVTDFEAYPQWRSGLESVERLPDQASMPAWREQIGTEAISYQVVEWDAPRALRTLITDDDLPFGGTWTFDIRESADGATVSITEDGQVYSALFRFVARFVIGHDRTMNQYLDDLEGYLSS